MTWFLKEQGYELFFNRDERVSRSYAELPRVQITENIETISPTDSDAGGTWISANQYGVTVCLLNHYQFEQIVTYKNWISRGAIVRRFALTSDLKLAEKQFLQLDLNDYRAFRMFIISSSGSNVLCVWDGHRGRVERNVSKPKSSSAVDAKHVKRMRRDQFEKLGLAESTHSEDYLRFHASHLPTKSKESVCMHRDDANTVSLSHIDVDQNLVRFRYADGPPCSAKLGSAIAIERTQIPAPENIVVIAGQ